MLNTKVFTVITSAILFWTTTDVVQGRYVYQPQINRSVQLNKVVATWEQAKQQCERQGAILASPITETLLEYMTSIIDVNDHKSSYFIGMTIIENTENFASIEGILLDDLPETVINMIDKLDPREGDCLAMTRNIIQPVPCWSRLPYICYLDATTSNDMYLMNTTWSTTEESVSEIDIDRWSTYTNRYIIDEYGPTTEWPGQHVRGPSDCGSGYTFYPATESCYKLHTEEKTWDNAKSTCYDEGGYLVVLNNRQEANIVENIQGAANIYRKWIGLRVTHGNWISVQGDNLEQIFNVWSQYRTYDDRTCGSIVNGGALDNQYCDINYPFICEKSKGEATSPTAPNVTTPEPSNVSSETVTDCGSGYKRYSTGSCYKMHDEYKSWDDAQVMCTSEGGYLAVINDEHEARVLKSISFVDNYEFIRKWIGLRKVDGNWRSVRGDLRGQIFDKWSSTYSDLPCGTLKIDGLLDDQRCGFGYRFICEKSENETTTSTTPHTITGASADDCGSGYTLYSTGSCYKVHDEYKTWDEANSTCSDEGGYLVVINNRNEAQLVKNIANRPNDRYIRKWIGLRDVFGDWQSIHGDNIDDIYNTWSDSVSGLPCGCLDIEDGLLDDQSCDIHYRFICEKRKEETTTPTASYSTPASTHMATNTYTTDCGSGYTRYSTGSCYKVHDEYKTWDDAQSTCSSEGGYLAVINDEHEAQILTSITRRPNDNYIRKWIGLRKVDGDWRSVRGDRFSQIFNVWSSSVSGLPCGCFKTEGLLDDQECDFSYRFICEKSEEENTAPTPTPAPTHVATDTTIDCGPGYTRYSTGSCYKVHDEYKSWDDAQSTCSSEGGYLAVINDEHEAQILKDITRRPNDNYIRKWIGLRKVDGDWRSVRGDRFSQIFNVWSSSVSGLPCGCFKTEGLLDDQECDFSYRFICEKSEEEYTAPTPTPAPTHVATDTTIDCGPGYTRYSTGSCYKVHDEYKSWDDAQTTCSSEGGYLAVINDEHEAQILKSITYRPHDNFMRKWIGLRKIDGDWRSVRGDRFNQIFNVWSDSVSGLPCGCFKTDGLLDDQECDFSYRFICEKSEEQNMTPTPASYVTTEITDVCGSGYTRYSTGSCYKVHDEYKSWDDAQSTCSSEGGYLAVINDEHEAQILKSITSRPHDNFMRKWIGLRKVDGDWRSVLGDRFDQIFNVWSDTAWGVPCGCLKDEGLLDDQYCDFKYRFICEKSNNDETMTPTAPQVLYQTTSPKSAPTYVTSETPTDCGSGYTRYSTGSCYKVHDEYKSWDDAQSTCSSEGGYLAVINDEHEAQILKSITSRPRDNFIRKWIGLRNIGGDWRSVRGDRFSQIFNVWSDSVSGLPCGCFKTDGLLDDQSCGQEYRFICEKSEEENTAPTPTPAPTHVATDTTIDCGPGYTRYSTGSCYKVHDEYKSWNDAQSTCSSEGGYLAVINDEHEAQILKSITSRPHDNFVRKWIGLRKIDGDWRSVRGDRFSQIFNVWSDSVSGLPCGCFKTDGLLDDQSCGQEYRFICEKSEEENTTPTAVHGSTPASTHMTTETTDVCGSGYTPYQSTGSCYKVHDEYKSWDDAQSTCSSEGGYLAVINDEHEAQILKSITSRPGDNYVRKWIGLRKVDGDWRSVRGDRFSQIFNVWSDSVSGLSCGCFKRDGLLDDQSCDFGYRFICEKNYTS